MARPSEFEDLTTTSVTVGRHQLKEAKKHDINLSELLRNALDGALKTPAQKAKTSGARKKLKGMPVGIVERALKVVGRNPEAAGHQAEEINNSWGVDISGEDLLELVPRF